MAFLEVLQALMGGDGPGVPRVGGDILPHGDVEVRLESFGRKKIAVIKEVRKFGGYGLKEAKDLVEAAPTVVFRVATQGQAAQAAAALRAVGAAATFSGSPAEALKAPAGYHVHIEQPKRKIAAIKALRSALNLDLREAKRRIELAPVSLGPFDEDVALRVLMALTEEGVVAEIR